jgi:Xaa-Pro dipeptidase
MDARSLFADHMETVHGQLDQALAVARAGGASFDSIVFHAGSEQMYHADDQPVAFRTVAHFARLAPLPGADHFILYRPGERLRLVRVAPADFWYEPPAEIDHPYVDAFDIDIVGSRRAAIAALAPTLGNGSGATAYIGNSPSVAAELALPAAAVEPKALLAALNWSRAYKTPYEIECVRAAASIAGLGHAAVRRGFAKQRSEWALHMDYLSATSMLDAEVPYTNIIAWDHLAATLHYQGKNRQAPDAAHVLLIDAGATVWGYASDITRTYCTDEAHPVFRQLLDAMDTLQLQLVDQVGPDMEYIDVHAAAHRGVAALLHSAGILKVSAEEAYARGLTRPFLPHGVGHHLGLQVHDVGGHQINAQGDVKPPSAEHPHLRTTRRLEAGHVVTIEPGLYFIPLLLDPHRTGEHASAFHWPLIDALIPFGGIRIEDDVAVTSSGRDNLSRPFVHGHREPLLRR